MQLNHHILLAMITLAIRYIQEYTKDNLPDVVMTKHDFKDGEGKVEAIPVDRTTLSTEIVDGDNRRTMGHGSDNITEELRITDANTRVTLGHGVDNITLDCHITSATYDPNPILLQIENMCPSLVERVVPVRTAALPGHPFVFEVVLYEPETYVDGDIIATYGTLQFDHDSEKLLLTVNSNEDLTVKLVLKPNPQEWLDIPPTILPPDDPVQPAEQMSNIPRDGVMSTSKLTDTQRSYWFSVVRMTNDATNFVTNRSASERWTVNDVARSITIPFTYASGYDHNDLYWKCFDETQEGYYKPTDYNPDVELPAEYEKVRYVYNNGVNYFDTGHILKAGDRVNMLCYLDNRTDVSYVGLFGARSADTPRYAYVVYSRYNNRTTPGFQRGSGVYHVNNNDVSITGKLLEIDCDGRVCQFKDGNGGIIYTATATAENDIDTQYSCYVFTDNDWGSPYGNRAYGYVYRFSITDAGGNLKVRLVPCVKRSTGRIGFYDTVSGTFLQSKYNFGIGQDANLSYQRFLGFQQQMQCSDPDVIMYWFTGADRNAEYTLPEGYTKQCYLENSTSATMDTGYRLRATDRIETEVNIPVSSNNSYQALFGARQSPSDREWSLWTRDNGVNHLAFRHGTDWKTMEFPYDTDTKIVFDVSTVTMYDSAGRVIGRSANTTEPPETNRNVWLFGINNSNSVNDYLYYGKMYYFRVWDSDGNLVLNLVPCKRNSDGESGMYDTVTGSFRTYRSSSYKFTTEPLGVNDRKLVLSNVTHDVSLGIAINPAYKYPMQVSDTGVRHWSGISTEIDPVTHERRGFGTQLAYYFCVIKLVNYNEEYFYLVGPSKNTTTNSYNYTPVVNTDSGVYSIEFRNGYDDDDMTVTQTDSSYTPLQDPTADIVMTHGYRPHPLVPLPNGYTQLQYIHNNASSSYMYIDTAYIPKIGDKVLVDYYMPSDSYNSSRWVTLFGCSNANGHGSAHFSLYVRADGNGDNYNYARQGNKTIAGGAITNALVHGEFGDTDGTWTYGPITKSVDLSDTGGTLADCTTTMRIFGQNANWETYQAAYARIYSFKMENFAGNTIMDMVPVRYTDTVADKVDHNPTATLPDGYTKLNALYSNGAWLNTEYIPHKDDRIEIILSITPNQNQTYEAVFCGRRSNNSYEWGVHTGYGSRHQFLLRHYQSRAGDHFEMYQPNTVYRLVCDGPTFTMYDDGGEQVFAYTETQPQVDCTHPLYLFATNNGGSAADGGLTAWLYSFKIYDSTGSLVLDYVPAKHGETIGLYDMVSQTFKPPTSGTFTAPTLTRYGMYDLVRNTFYNNCNGTLSTGTHVNRSYVTVRNVTEDVFIRIDKDNTNKIYTPIAEDEAVQSTSCISEYDPTLGGNRGLGMQRIHLFMFAKVTIVTDSAIVRFDSGMSTTFAQKTNASTPDVKEISFDLYFANGYSADNFVCTDGGIITDVDLAARTGKLTFANLIDDVYAATLTEKPATITPIDEEHALLHTAGLSYPSVIEYEGTNVPVNMGYGTLEFYFFRRFHFVIDPTQIALTNPSWSTTDFIQRDVNGSQVGLTFLDGTGAGDYDIFVSPDTYAEEILFNNSGVTIPYVPEDLFITIAKKNYNRPKIDPNSDLLGIFSDPDSSDFNQYYVFIGDGRNITSYSFINGHSSLSADLTVYEINPADFDIISFDPSSVPGEVPVRYTRMHTASSISESVANYIIDGNTYYKHSIVFSHQIVTEVGMQYLFCVRDSGEISQKIAIVNETASSNLLQFTANDVKFQNNRRYLDFQTANKNVVSGLHKIYFEINNTPIV